MRVVDRILSQLPGTVGLAYRRCLGGPSVPSQCLADDVGEYLRRLKHQAQEAEFIDLETATRAASGCRALLRQLDADQNEQHHHAVQAAVAYFLLEDDGEGDDSIIGFDDDLHVVQVTAEVLGWSLQEEDA